MAWLHTLTSTPSRQHFESDWLIRVDSRYFFTWNVNQDLLNSSRLVMVTKRLAVAMLAALALGAAGCFSLPLMLGSLGYEGYEYHKTGTLPGMPPGQSSSSSTARPAAYQTPSPDDIE